MSVVVSFINVARTPFLMFVHLLSIRLLFSVSIIFCLTLLSIEKEMLNKIYYDNFLNYIPFEIIKNNFRAPNFMGPYASAQPKYLMAAQKMTTTVDQM